MLGQCATAGNEIQCSSHIIQGISHLYGAAASLFYNERVFSIEGYFVVTQSPLTRGDKT